MSEDCRITELERRAEKLEKAVADLEQLLVHRHVAKTVEQLQKEAGGLSEEMVLVHWPGKDTVACPEHFRKLVGLATVLGFQLSCTPTDSSECDNCKTEAERETRMSRLMHIHEFLRLLPVAKEVVNEPK